MKEIIVIGHKNPDTDSVVAAKALSYILNKEGKDSVSRISGKHNKETEFVFNSFNEDVPNIVSDEEIKEGSFFLVDHNDLQQSVAGKDNICGVLDHHLLSGLKTDNTIYFRVEELGSTSSLVYKLLKEKNIELTKEVGRLLLAGIISDTLNLNSPTTTTEDIDYYHELAEITQVDPENLAQEMFKAKSDFSGCEIKEVLIGDMKSYSFGEKKIAIGVAEVTSFEYFDENKNLIMENLPRIKEEEDVEAFFLCLIDIIKGCTRIYPAAEEELRVVKEVFNGEEKGDYFFLENVSSKKKEIAPPLSKYYENIK